MKRIDDLLAAAPSQHIVVTAAWCACDPKTGILGELAAGHRCD